MSGTVVPMFDAFIDDDLITVTELTPKRFPTMDGVTEQCEVWCPFHKEKKVKYYVMTEDLLVCKLCANTTFRSSVKLMNKQVRTESEQYESIVERYIDMIEACINERREIVKQLLGTASDAKEIIRKAQLTLSDAENREKTLRSIKRYFYELLKEINFWRPKSKCESLLSSIHSIKKYELSAELEFFFSVELRQLTAILSRVVRTRIIKKGQIKIQLENIAQRMIDKIGQWDTETNISNLTMQTEHYSEEITTLSQKLLLCKLFKEQNISVKTRQICTKLLSRYLPVCREYVQSYIPVCRRPSGEIDISRYEAAPGIGAVEEVMLCMNKPLIKGLYYSEYVDANLPIPIGDNCILSISPAGVIGVYDKNTSTLSLVNYIKHKAVTYPNIEDWTVPVFYKDKVAFIPVSGTEAKTGDVYSLFEGKMPKELKGIQKPPMAVVNGDDMSLVMGRYRFISGKRVMFYDFNLDDMIMTNIAVPDDGMSIVGTSGLPVLNEEEFFFSTGTQLFLFRNGNPELIRSLRSLSTAVIPSNSDPSNFSKCLIYNWGKPTVIEIPTKGRRRGLETSHVCSLVRVYKDVWLTVNPTTKTLSYIRISPM